MLDGSTGRTVMSTRLGSQRGLLSGSTTVTGQRRAVTPGDPACNLSVVEDTIADRAGDDAHRLGRGRTFRAQIDAVLLPNRARRAGIDRAAIAGQHGRRIATALVVTDEHLDTGIGLAIAGRRHRGREEVGWDWDPAGPGRDDDLLSPAVDRHARRHSHVLAVVLHLDVEPADHAVAEHEPVEQSALADAVRRLELEILHAEQLTVEVAVAQRRLESGARVGGCLVLVHRSSRVSRS